MAKMDFFDRAFQTPFDCQAIFTILPANLIGYAFLLPSRSDYATAGQLRSKPVSLRKTAHAIRANLFASATTMTLR